MDNFESAQAAVKSNGLLRPEIDVALEKYKASGKSLDNPHFETVNTYAENLKNAYSNLVKAIEKVTLAHGAKEANKNKGTMENYQIALLDANGCYSDFTKAQKESGYRFSSALKKLEEATKSVKFDLNDSNLRNDIYENPTIRRYLE